ncbi:hypothetical protein DYY65_11595 [Nitrososphaera sp. AFS]|nr:hypothetical protein [Nitrososphaera sp. AFS]
MAFESLITLSKEGISFFLSCISPGSTKCSALADFANTYSANDVPKELLLQSTTATAAAP